LFLQRFVVKDEGDFMPSVDLKNNTVATVAIGCGVAVGWYGVSSYLLSGTAGAIVPAFGAIAIAGVFPTQFFRSKAEKKAIQSRLSMSQRLEALNQHASINIVDAQNRLTEVNDRLLHLTGYDRDELIGEQIEILYDDPANSRIDQVRNFLKNGKTWQGETQLRRKDGSMLITQSTIMPLFDESGELAGSISARTDVTKKNTLMAERHTAQTLNELRDDIWIVDSKTEKFSYMNRAAKKRLSVVEDEYRSNSLGDFGRDSEIDQVLQACRELRKDGESATQFQSSLMDVPMYVSIKFLPGSNGKGRYLILFNDISERIEHEKHKSAFISTVSHELRSPLTSIKGAMGLLLSGSAGELPDKALKLLEIAHRNADRLVLILNDILDLDKIATGQMDFDIQNVDLADLVKETDEATSMLQQRFGVSVTMHGTDSPVTFRTDPNRFIQILTNFMSNAYKFSPSNGNIEIAIEETQENVRISVTDEGQGIPLDEQHKIFDRFADMTNSDRAAKGGTGLGLSICKAIVESLGGTIGFDTEEGVGTTFYFTLPKALPTSVLVEADKEKLTA
jgi:PAS domain S-box-containing protein